MGTVWSAEVNGILPREVVFIHRGGSSKRVRGAQFASGAPEHWGWSNGPQPTGDSRLIEDEARKVLATIVRGLSKRLHRVWKDVKIRPVNIVRKYLLWVWLAFGTTVFLLVTSSARLGPRPFTRRVAHWMARWWARGVLRTTGARCTVEGADQIVSDGPYVVMSNHRSHMDIPLLIQHLPLFFGFIVKAELERIPIFGAAMKGIGCVAVKRSKGKADHAVLDGVAEAVAAGQNILVFPEGTRAPTDDFLPFKKGGVVVALKAGVPILPVAVCGTNRVIPARVLSVTAGPLLLRIGTPIPTEGLTLDDRDALLSTVREAIVDLYEPGYPGSAA